MISSVIQFWYGTTHPRSRCSLGMLRICTSQVAIMSRILEGLVYCSHEEQQRQEVPWMAHSFEPVVAHTACDQDPMQWAAQWRQQAYPPTPRIKALFISGKALGCQENKLTICYSTAMCTCSDCIVCTIPNQLSLRQRHILKPTHCVAQSMVFLLSYVCVPCGPDRCITAGLAEVIAFSFITSSYAAHGNYSEAHMEWHEVIKDASNQLRTVLC